MEEANLKAWSSAMPVHDWTLVRAGTFHDFHCAWLPLIKDRLNNGILPSQFYAQTEQRTERTIPDVLTLRGSDEPAAESDFAGGQTATITQAPPQVEIVTDLELSTYAEIARSLVVRHSSGDDVVAILELVSPGNKWSERSMRRFLEKMTVALHSGVHLLVIDPHPPTPRDPEGIHGAIWSELGDDSYRAPKSKPLTMAAYAAGFVKTAYVQPFAVGDQLKDMPLFLDADHYVNVPLEDTYQAAFHGIPQRYRDLLAPNA